MVFIVLQNGLFIENISTKNFQINKLYIKWNESLDISIKEINIKKNEQDSSLKPDLKKVSKELSKFHNYYNFFEKISINKIFYDDLEASFRYERGENGYINVNSPDFTLRSSLFFESHLLNIQIDKMRDDTKDITLNGNIIVNTTKHSVASKMKINIHNELELTFLASANEKNIFYTIDSDKDIQSISYVIKLLNLYPEVNYWADEAITFSSLSLDRVYGWVDFNDIDNAYKNIYASATGHDLNYKYNKKLDAIHTKQTDLIFKNGILYIYPKEAHTYKSKLGKSWLQIDFTQKEEILTLKLIFDGKLDKDTLHILNSYKIKVPFLQNSGKTNVDLTLKVNLISIDVNAEGKFFTKKANFTYLDRDIDVTDAYIKLNNYDVTINNMLAKYKDIASAKLDVIYNAQKGQGEINFNVSKIDFKDLDLSLDTKNRGLKAKYTIAPHKDTISVMPSKWNFKDKEMRVGEMKIPFNLKTLILKVPNTNIFLENLAKTTIFGSLDLNSAIGNFTLKIKELHSDYISFSNPKEPSLDIHYNKQLSVKIKERIDFKVGSRDAFFNETTFYLKDSILSMDQTYIQIDDIIKGKLSLEYSLEENIGKIKTQRLRVKSDSLGELYLESSDTDFDVTKQDENLNIFSKDLGISFLYNDSSWRFDLNSVSRLARNSKLLQKYNVTKGKASIYKDANNENMQINSTLYSSNKIMVKENVPLEKYIVLGEVQKDTNIITLNINKDVNIRINDEVVIDMKNTGVNLNALVDIINAKGGDLKNYSDTKVSLSAKNSYLYISPTRHVLSQKINLHYVNKALTARLQHKKGVANVKFKNGVFHVAGEGFNDEFMQNLFSLSKFNEGTLRFTMSGTPSKYDGLITIDNTTLLDYKILNNILAFVNTVPTLVTFSVPNYSATGLKVKTAYMKFASRDNTFHISDVYLDSGELDILGMGTASFLHNTIDLQLNLKTDLGSTISKVPLVGYILMDKDSISTTLSITGALDDPKVNTLIAKDIAVAPLNILLRTISLPAYLLNNLGEESTKKKLEDTTKE